MASLQDVANWLEQTQLSQTIQTVPWIIPTVQSLHILAIAAVIGAMGFLDLRVLGIAARRQSVTSLRKRLMPWLWRALIVLLVTGILMIVGEPGRSLINPIFGLKMAMLVIAVAATLWFTNSLRTIEGTGDTVRIPTLAKVGALIALVLWVAIIFAGRWIAYSDTLFGGGL